MKYYMWPMVLCFVLSDVLYGFDSNTTRSGNNSTESSFYVTEISQFNGSDDSFQKLLDEFNSTRFSEFSGESCPHSSCSDNTSDPFRSIRACMCDEDCMKYRDCCDDSEYYNRTESAKPALFEYQTIRNLDYAVRSTCASSWEDEEIMEKCALSKNRTLNTENIDLQIPATSVVTNITYGNIFCAFCNYELDNVQLWNVTVEDFCLNAKYDAALMFQFYLKMNLFSNSSENSSQVYPNHKQLEDPSSLEFDGSRWYFVYDDTSYYCDLTLVPPTNVRPESCIKKLYLVDSCSKNWTDSDVLEQCNASYSRVFDKFGPGIYKNKYCAYCNGRNNSQLTCRPSHSISVQYDRGNSQIAISLNGHRPFTVLFDFKSKRLSKVCYEEHESYSKLKERICPKNENHTTSGNENWIFTTYTSIAVLASLIFLILHLTIFSVVKELHTIGGKNIASFSAALVLAYSCFLFGNHAKGGLCSAIAVIMYYSFLSAFSWMLTISYDMWRTFWNATKKFTSPRNPKKTFFIYSVWSWGVPMIPVVIAVYIDFTFERSALAPHFGDNGCWFENGYSLFLFFVAPVCVIIVVNFCLFLHTSLMLHNSQCKSANQKSRVDFKLYARIALLTGFSWITGFVAGFTQSLTAWFIFILLNTAQGVLIFTAFSCKKRIILSFLKRIGKFERWQASLRQSNVKSNNTVSTTLTNVAENTRT